VTITYAEHEIYSCHDARGNVLVKCRCGFEATAPTEAEARAAHDAA